MEFPILTTNLSLVYLFFYPMSLLNLLSSATDHDVKRLVRPPTLCSPGLQSLAAHKSFIKNSTCTFSQHTRVSQSVVLRLPSGMYGALASLIFILVKFLGSTG